LGSAEKTFPAGRRRSLADVRMWRGIRLLKHTCSRQIDFWKGISS
jgi:hypothetical protein